MTHHAPSQPEPPPAGFTAGGGLHGANPGASADPSTAYHRDMLRDAADLTLDLAKKLHHQASTQAEAGGPGRTDAAETFTHLIRCLRQTLYLDRKFAAEDAGGKSSEAEQARRAAMLAQRKATARKQLRRTLETSITNDGYDREHAENLMRDIDERLADDDIDAELLVTTIHDLARRLCADYAITPDFDRLTDEDRKLLHYLSTRNPADFDDSTAFYPYQPDTPPTPAWRPAPAHDPP